MIRPSLVAAAAALCLAAPPLRAQEPTPPKQDATAKLGLLSTCLAAAQNETSLLYELKTKIESQFTRAMAGRAAPEPAVIGTWTPAGLHLSIDEGADELHFAGRRLIARTKDGAWALRSAKTFEGRPLPFHVDPELLFRVLGAAKFEFVSSEVGALDDRPVEIVTVRLTDDAARECELTGILPAGSDLGGFIAIRMAGGRAAAPPKNEVEIDFAFFVDPATKRLLKLRMRSFTKMAGMGANFVIAGAAGGQEEDEEEEESDSKKGKAEAPLKLKDGLPVRTKPKKDNWTIATVDLVLKEHGAAKLPELDAGAQALLGTTPKK